MIGAFVVPSSPLGHPFTVTRSPEPTIGGNDDDNIVGKRNKGANACERRNAENMIRFKDKKIDNL